MPIVPMSDWGEAIRTALAGALTLFLAGIPRIQVATNEAI